LDFNLGYRTLPPETTKNAKKDPKKGVWNSGFGVAR